MTTLSALSTLHNKINDNIRLETYSASSMHIRIYIYIPIHIQMHIHTRTASYCTIWQGAGNHNCYNVPVRIYVVLCIHNYIYTVQVAIYPTNLSLHVCMRVSVCL